MIKSPCLDTQFERLDIPFFAEQALLELSYTTDLSLSQKLQNFAHDILCLSPEFRLELTHYLQQRMLSETQMNARFMLKMLLDTADAVIQDAPLPRYICG